MAYTEGYELRRVQCYQKRGFITSFHSISKVPRVVFRTMYFTVQEEHIPTVLWFCLTHSPPRSRARTSGFASALTTTKMGGGNTADESEIIVRTRANKGEGKGAFNTRDNFTPRN